MVQNGTRRAIAAAAAFVCLLCGVSYAAAREDAPAPAPAPSSAQRVDTDATRLLQPPRLEDPVVRTIRPGSTWLRLDPGRDYRLQIALDVVLTSGVVVLGGRNVVLEPGTLRYARPPGVNPSWTVRGLYLKGQTGIAYVSGLRIRGPLKEGINLDQRAPGAVVVLRDVEVDPVQGSEAGHHADLLQTWAGPSKLVVDGFRGASTYQGFFLLPNQEWTTGPQPEYFWLRDVELDLTVGRYAFWTDGGGRFPVQVHATAVRRNPTRQARDQWLWPRPSTGDTTWSAVVGR
jgi:hypothetical protein